MINRIIYEMEMDNDETYINYDMPDQDEYNHLINIFENACYLKNKSVREKLERERKKEEFEYIFNSNYNIFKDYMEADYIDAYRIPYIKSLKGWIDSLIELEKNNPSYAKKYIESMYNICPRWKSLDVCITLRKSKNFEYIIEKNLWEKRYVDPRYHSIRELGLSDEEIKNYVKRRIFTIEKYINVCCFPKNKDEAIRAFSLTCDKTKGLSYGYIKLLFLIYPYQKYVCNYDTLVNMMNWFDFDNKNQIVDFVTRLLETITPDQEFCVRNIIGLFENYDGIKCKRLEEISSYLRISQNDVIEYYKYSIRKLCKNYNDSDNKLHYRINKEV